MTAEQLELAGQYVLGLLEGEDLAAFERQLAGDPALASAVGLLVQQFHALDDTATSLPINPALWSAIEQRIDTGSTMPSANLYQLPRRTRTARQQGFYWPAMAASLLVALGLGYFAGSFGPVERQPVMIAVLLDQTDASPGALIEAFADDSVRLVPLEQFAFNPNQVLQVWTLPDVATGPVSLGTFTDPAAIRLSAGNLPSPQSGQLYEITLEPAPGSPTGRPTGPILVKGFAKAPLS